MSVHVPGSVRFVRRIGQVWLALILLIGSAPSLVAAIRPVVGWPAVEAPAAAPIATAPIAAGAPQVIAAVTAPRAATPEPPLSSALPEEVVGKAELTARRTADSATYDLGDGRYALVQDTQLMHYQDADGAWRRIDPAFAPVTNGWANTTNALQTGIAARSGRANVMLGATGVVWSPHSLAVVARDGSATPWATALAETDALTGALSADGRAVTYAASWSDPALQERWESGYGQAEYTLRMAASPAMPAVTGGTLELRVGLHLLPGTHLQINGAAVTAAMLPLEATGALALVNGAGAPLWLQAPQAYEESDPTERVGGRYTLSAGADAATYELAARIPYDWLTAADRQFPVVLDPVFQVEWPTTAKVAFSENPTPNFDEWLNANPIGLGQLADGVARAYIYFSMPSLPTGATIDSAYLEALPYDGQISCPYDIAHPDVCASGPSTRPGLSTAVQVYALVTTDWWLPGHNEFPVPGSSYGGAQTLAWSSAGRTVARWNIKTLVNSWRFASNNKGIMLKLENEFCYQERSHSSTYFSWTERYFPDGCGWFYIQNPSLYTPGASATDFTAADSQGGVRLVVTYSAPTLDEGEIIPCDAPTCSNPAVGEQYFQTAHQYTLSGNAPAHWQAVVARGWGGAIETCPPDEGTLLCGQNLDESVLLNMSDAQDNVLAAVDRTSAGALSYALLNRRAAPTPAYHVRVEPNATDAPADAYDIRLATENSSIQVTAGTPTVIDGEFDSNEPFMLWNLDLPANTHSRVDIEILGHNHINSNGAAIPGTYDYARHFNAHLYNSDQPYLGARDIYKPLQSNVKASDTNLGYGAVRLGSGIFTAGAADYALAFTYDGPAASIYTCVGTCSPALAPAGQMVVDPLVFNYRLRITSCSGDTFPTRSGVCQALKCPTTSFPRVANVGGMQLWSEAGWSGGQNNDGSAPLVGNLGDVAPSVAVVGGKIIYNSTANTVAFDADSEVLLVNCGTLAQPTSPVGNNYFDIYSGAMVNADDAYDVWMEPVGQGNNHFNPWRAQDEPDIISTARRPRVFPTLGQAIDSVRLRRRTGNNLEFNVTYGIYATGWPSLYSAVSKSGTVQPPPVADVLLLTLGSEFSMDTSPAAGREQVRWFEAIRAESATIAQPDDLGGASLPVRAVIVGPGQMIEGQPCASGVNCVDVRAPDDVYPGIPKRTWQMPDIHTGGKVGMVMVNTPGQLYAWSTDHPAAVDSPQEAAEEFSFDTFGASVKVTQEKCDTDAIVTVIRGETQMSLPMIGDDGQSHTTMVAARFKLCGDPDVALRMVEFEFRSPVGVPVGSTGLFVYGMKGTVEITPGYTGIHFAMDFYFGDPNTLQGTGEVTISTDGMFQFQGQGKILGVVDATGSLWVAWNPLDTGFEMELRYALGSVAELKGTVRAHAWRGQGWQHKYAWLPDNPGENHFTAQIAATFTLYEGAVIDMWPLVIPPEDFKLGYEIAFGQFCTNASCSTYEWGIKAGLKVCGYTVGIYYGFDHGVDLILGNDNHTLIDQYGGAAYAQSTLALPLGEGQSPPVNVLAAPQAVNGSVTLPITVTADTEELLLGMGWQSGNPILNLYRPGSNTPVYSNTTHAVFISNTLRNDANFGEVHTRLLGVQLKQPGAAMAGIWHAVITNVVDENHFKFVFLANKGAPGTPADRGAFTAPGVSDVNGTGVYTIRWRVDADAPPDATISLYYTRYYNDPDEGVQPIPDTQDTPIAQHLDYQTGAYQWNTAGLLAKCAFSTDGRYSYGIRAIVDDGVNTFPAGSVSDSGDFCKPCSEIPSERAFDSNRFPGVSTFSSVGRIWVTDTTPPATPTGLEAHGVAGALLAQWNPVASKDLAFYLVEWGRVTCPGLGDCVWNANNPTHAERVAPVLTPTLRIGGVTTSGMVIGDSYGVVVSAVDVNGNVSPRSAIDSARPTSNAAAQVPTAPITPTISNPTSTGVQLSWSSSGDPDHYRLIYRQVISLAMIMQVDDIDAHDYPGFRTGNVTLTGLKTGATYVAWATAANSEGWHSPYSPPVTFTVSNGVNTDGTAAPDDWEAVYQVVAMYNNDEDFDGLTDAAEYRAGTHPRRQDSDGDSYSDREETDAGADPLSGSSYPAVYTQPRLALERYRVDFYAKQGQATLLSENVDFYNNGGGALNLTVADNAAWLSAFVEAGVGKNYIRVFANLEALEPGIYDAIVRVGSSSGLLIGGTKCIRVRLHLLAADSDTPYTHLYLPLVTLRYPPQWNITALDVSADNGKYVSGALDPRDGIPFFSYYDVTNGDLRLASPVTPGNGNCGAGAAWWCRAVKITGDVGRYSSLAIWYGGSMWKLGIAYYNADLAALEYAKYVEGVGWSFTVVDAGDPATLRLTGLYPTLKYDANGTPYIAYYQDKHTGVESVKLARYVGGSVGNCGESQWQCDTVESGEAIGSHPALDLDPDNQPHIAYYDGQNNTLRYARYVGSGGNCGSNSAWQCDAIEAATAPSSDDHLIALRAVSGATLKIAYSAVVSGVSELHYATSTAGECGPNNTWTCIRIASGVEGVAIANGTGTRLAYHDAEGGQLVLAHPASPAEKATCGPLVGFRRTWSCSVIDSGDRNGGIPNHVGHYPAFVLADGLARIAYYDFNLRDLTVAIQQY